MEMDWKMCTSVEQEDRQVNSMFRRPLAGLSKKMRKYSGVMPVLKMWQLCFLMQMETGTLIFSLDQEAITQDPGAWNFSTVCIKMMVRVIFQSTPGLFPIMI